MLGMVVGHERRGWDMICQGFGKSGHEGAAWHVFRRDVVA